MKTIYILFFLVISANVFAQAEKENMMKKVEEWNKVFSKAMVEGDNKTILSFYVNDAYSLPSYSPMMVGKKEIEAGMKSSGQAGAKLSSFILTTKDIWMSGNLLCEVGTYKLSIGMSGSDNAVGDYGKYLTIYEKQKEGSWKIKADIWNTDTNPWANMQQK